MHKDKEIKLYSNRDNNVKMNEERKEFVESADRKEIRERRQK